MNSTETLKDPLNWVASVAMVANAGFGVFCNSMIVYIFIKTSAERNSFNLICAYRALINSFILIVAFLFMFVPIALFGDNLFPGVYQYLVITTVNSLYMSLQYCEVLVGVNRFCAMYIPILYAKFFNVTVTSVVVVVIFIYRVSKIYREAIVAIPKECFILYSARNLAWGPNFSENCKVPAEPDSIVSGTALFLIVLIVLNLLTFTKIWLFYKSTEASDISVAKKMKKNRVLFVQTLFQDATFLVDMLFTFKLYGVIQSRYWTFISGSFVWESVHSFDGFIMMLFNERLTFLKNNLFPSTTETTAALPNKSSLPPTRNTLFKNETVIN